jgi:heme exporter protein B
MKAWLALVRADLNLLIRRPENLLSTILYGIMVLVIVHFSIPSGTGQSLVMGTAALWLAMVLSGVLGLPRLQHHPDAVRMLPQLMTGNSTTGAYYWSKLISGGIVMVITSLLLFSVGMMIFNFPLSGRLATALAVYGLGAVGVVTVLTMGGALTVGREEWLLPVIVFPLMLPIVLAGTQLMAGVLHGDRSMGMGWVHLLIAYDALMLLGGWFLSEFIWEELPE